MMKILHRLKDIWNMHYTDKVRGEKQADEYIRGLYKTIEKADFLLCVQLVFGAGNPAGSAFGTASFFGADPWLRPARGTRLAVAGAVFFGCYSTLRSWYF